jgi:polysaccharide biosynthesis/export protein
MKAALKGCLVGLFVSVLAGCGTLGAPQLPARTTGHEVLVDAYRMDVGDQVQISVWNNADLSVSEPVRPDGMIAVPLVGDIMAAGRTPEELAVAIEAKLSNYIKAPNVTVILTGLEGHAYLSRIRVTGAVGKNSSMTYHQGMTVLDAVLDAGSVNLYADGNRTKLHRRTASGPKTYDIRMQDILENGDMTTNVQLLPGDVITVPEKAF